MAYFKVTNCKWTTNR